MLPTKPLILVVDDSPDIRLLVCTVLKHSGFATITASNGVEALEQVQQHQPAALVLDLNMPLMPGWDVARIMSQEHPMIPVIIMTGQASLPSQVLEQVPTAAKVLIKPFEMPELISSVSTVLSIVPKIAA